MIRHEKSMQLSPWNLVRRRFSNMAAALVIASLLLGSAGAMSVLTVDAFGPAAPHGPYLRDAESLRGLR
ncbi:hypothetical protein [Bosea caraganae]|nr:hypothetical protein [Bosea caraganae]